MTFLAPLRGMLGPLGAALGVAPSLQAGLVAYWKLDENAGTTAADSAGTNTGTFLGTLGGAQWATGKINSGGFFNGTDRYVDAGSGSSLLFTTSMSISLWYKGTDSSGVVAGRWGAGAGGYCLEIDGDAPAGMGALAINFGGTNAFASTSPTRVDDGVWHHLVGTWDGTTISMYLDAVLKNTAARSGTTTAPTASFKIGAAPGGGGATAGSVDEVGVWNRALTAAEVTALYNGGAGMQP